MAICGKVEASERFFGEDALTPTALSPSMVDPLARWRSGASRWADVELSDGSDEEEDSLFQALLADSFRESRDDSDREAPDASLEQDSYFVLQRQVSGLESEPAWLPNANAPEFIPTMTSMCPLVGFLPEENLRLPSNVGHEECALGASSPMAFASSLSLGASSGISCADTVLADCSGEDARLAAVFSRPRKGRQQAASQSGICTRKRRPHALKAPAKKPTEKEQRDAGVASTCQVPSASEDDWQRRIEVRERAVAVGKATSEYQACIEAQLLNGCGEDDIVTPDPRDRTISKRRWKYELQNWRTALKQRYAQYVRHDAEVSGESEADAASTTCGTSTTCGDDSSSV